jgi:hypothetical protein
MAIGTASTDIKLPKTPQLSGFFRLPTEIRTIIFELVIGTKDIVFVHKRKGPCQRHVCMPYEHRGRTRSGKPKIAKRIQAHKNTKTSRALAYTCRQAYHEDLKIWYRLVEFNVHHLPCSSLFLNEIGAANRNAIRTTYTASSKAWARLPVE